MLGWVKTLEQPPPGPDELREVPPQGWRGMSPRQFWTMAGVGGVVTLLAAYIATTLVFRESRPAYRTGAINNAKQIGLALLEFDQEFGRMPSDATVADVVKATGTVLDHTDGSSNAMFRQLIAYGLRSEDIFFARHPEGTMRPDNDFYGRDALKHKEVGFSYVVGLDTKMDVDIPMLMTPMKTAGYDQFWIDEKYAGKAVILRLDNSAEAPLVRPSDDKVVDVHGVPILDAAQRYFGGKWPDIRHPKMSP